MPNPPLITLITDFGTREHYGGAVKGVLAQECPGCQIIDITHEVPPQDLLEGALTLASCYDSFPVGTIHIAVVDPGVGSERRGLIMQTEHYSFVAPDNGILSLVCDRNEPRRVISIEADHYFRKPVAPTFHARDIFAPVAGRMASGVSAEAFGPMVSEFRRLKPPPAKSDGADLLKGIVLHIDRFGNVITNLPESTVREQFGDVPSMLVEINGRKVTSHVQFYAQGTESELVSLFSSSGYLEVASAGKPAARLLEVQRGMPVIAKRAE